MKHLITVYILFFSCVALYSQPSIQWQKCLGGSGWDRATSIQQTFDSGYVVSGWSSSSDGDVTCFHSQYQYDYFIVKFDVSGNIQWKICLGGSKDDEANSIQQTNDSGYIVAGWTTSNDGDVTGWHSGGNCGTGYLCRDYWIVKLDASGGLQWQKCFGGSDGELANCIQQTGDGGYIVAGWTNSYDGDVTGNHGSGDYWIVKLNSAGAIQWQKCYGGSSVDEAYSVQQTFDGGYIVAGTSVSNDGDVTGNHGGLDYWILKIDLGGTIQWQKSLGGSGDDYANFIQQTSDSGYIVAGSTLSGDSDVIGHHGNYDAWIVKLSLSGTIQWKKCLGGSKDDFAFCIRQTKDSGYIVAGNTESNDGDLLGNNLIAPVWLVKLNNIGVIQWQKTYGGSGGELAWAIQQITDGSYIFAGESDSNDGDVSGNHGNGDYWVVKLSAYTGVEENANKGLLGIEIAPNPSAGIFYIRYKEPMEKTEVYNYLGERVFYKEGRIEEMDLRKQASGIYFYSVTVKDGGIFRGKIVKE